MGKHLETNAVKRGEGRVWVVVVDQLLLPRPLLELCPNKDRAGVVVRVPKALRVLKDLVRGRCDRHRLLKVL